ncbi:HetP family heterocyst commitment protein [Dolichospermum sp. FACHB-1091]|uniref:HetP family heterocyst commitment protein n=1 Tax=Dolichospermum sp. FACHB-1091 TaxID=2692798 RepID=UPI001F549DDE|nr:HetP family heterocyst commitment protein [Dolichospermum sp. FACHB-1091]
MMNQDIAGSSNNSEPKIHPEQLDQVVEAILAGKYSWACVLMLRFIGYNPMHYIPYRTYNRILKENARTNRSNLQNHEGLKIAKPTTEKKSESNLTSTCLNKIKDIAYLEVGGKQKAEARANTREKKSA